MYLGSGIAQGLQNALAIRLAWSTPTMRISRFATSSAAPRTPNPAEGFWKQRALLHALQLRLKA